MKEILNQIPENNAENTLNFYEVSEKRKELRQAISESDNKTIIEKHYDFLGLRPARCFF